MNRLKIPALSPHNHGANLLALSNGDLLCVWFGGSCEGKSDIQIQCSRFLSKEPHWSTPVILSDDTTRSEQNPILFESHLGEIWLVYTAQLGIHQESAIVRYRKSFDFGHTWTPVEDLFTTSGIFVRNPPVLLRDGTIILPAYYCKQSEVGFLGEDYSVVKISTDHGESWKEVVIHESRGLVHMSIVQLSSGLLVGFFRNRRADYVYKTISEDFGESWSVPEKTELPNNNASLQCIVLPDGNIAMVYNHINNEMAPSKTNCPPWFDPKDIATVTITSDKVYAPIWGVKRNPLSFAISSDEGISWTCKDLVTVDNCATKEAESEFSYPTICMGIDGVLHVAYTHLRKYIVHLWGVR